jgi:hypothetical protein
MHPHRTDKAERLDIAPFLMIAAGVSETLVNTIAITFY